MNRVRILVEGQTEETFVNDILSPHLNQMGVDPHAIFFGKNGKGGIIWNPAQLIPYVQMHEFEALLFSDTSILAASNMKVYKQLDDALQSFSCPEEINDNEQTHPSKRIMKLFIGYQKVLDGINIAREIGLAKIRQECPHFNEWITKLEDIGNQ